MWVAGVISAVPLLLIGLAYLQLSEALAAYELVAALIFLLYSGGLCGILFLAKWQPALLRWGLGRLQRAINPLLGRLKRPLLPEGWAKHNADEAKGAAVAIATRPLLLSLALALALGTHLLNLTSLATIFLAFGHALGFGALAAAYTLGFVFAVISIIPFDLGVLAGVMTLVYSSVGVPPARALVISVAFRGLNAWLPVALGFLLFRQALRSSNRDHPAGPS